MKILDFVQFGGPDWAVGSTIFEMRMVLWAQCRPPYVHQVRGTGKFSSWSVALGLFQKLENYG